MENKISSSISPDYDSGISRVLIPSFDTLPSEIFEHIVLFNLSIPDLFNLANTCKRFSELIFKNHKIRDKIIFIFRQEFFQIKNLISFFLEIQKNLSLSNPTSFNILKSKTLQDLTKDTDKLLQENLEVQKIKKLTITDKRLECIPREIDISSLKNLEILDLTQSSINYNFCLPKSLNSINTLQKIIIPQKARENIYYFTLNLKEKVKNGDIEIVLDPYLE